MSAGEQLYWSRLNQAVGAFCLEQSLQTFHEDKMICSLVGEELEWCGSHSYLFMASRYMQGTSRIAELEKRRASAESSFSKELANSAGLRKSLKQLQLTAEDAAWKQQEDLAHASNLLELEKSVSAELREKISELQAQLVEVEAFAHSADGKLAAQLEEELAQTRLQLVALQAERDSDDAILQNRRPQERLGLGAGQRSKGGEDRDSGRTIPLRRTNENRPANVWSASSETEERNSWHM
jgi:hypothetical protein